MIDTKALQILKNIMIIFLSVLVIKLCVFVINLASNLFFTEEKKMQSVGLLKQFLKIMIMILKDYDYYDNVTKNHFNKSLAMSTEDEQRFKSRN